jgi:ABC-type transporter Mla maintaining outer membrane lipid asymmetry ATPase subunit MlaF
VRLRGTPDEFQRSTDGVVEQFIHGRARGPMDA